MGDRKLLAGHAQSSLVSKLRVFWRDRKPTLLVAAGLALIVAWFVQGADKPRPPAPDPMKAEQCAATLVAGAARCLKPGEIFKDCDACPQMIVVPAGRFMMGSPSGEPERDTREQPVHPVTIPRHFAISRYEVTFQEWEACLADQGCNGYNPDDQGWGRGRQPVINLSWIDTQTYTAWITRKSGQPYRLASEAEWEYAARAGTTTPFYFGAKITSADANFKGSEPYKGSPRSEFRGRMLPVGSFKPNAFGIYDMHGNAREWVQDCMHDNYDHAPNDGSVWAKEDGGNCAYPVLRGGNYVSVGRRIRSAFRLGLKKDFRIEATGLRVTRALNDPNAAAPKKP